MYALVLGALLAVSVTFAYFLGIQIGKQQQRSRALAHIEALLRVAEVVRPHLTDAQLARGVLRAVNEIRRDLIRSPQHTESKDMLIFNIEKWKS